MHAHFIRLHTSRKSQRCNFWALIITTNESVRKNPGSILHNRTDVHFFSKNGLPRTSKAESCINLNSYMFSFCERQFIATHLNAKQTAYFLCMHSTLRKERWTNQTRLTAIVEVGGWSRRQRSKEGRRRDQATTKNPQKKTHQRERQQKRQKKARSLTSATSSPSIKSCSPFLYSTKRLKVCPSHRLFLFRHLFYPLLHSPSCPSILFFLFIVYKKNIAFPSIFSSPLPRPSHCCC